MQKLLARGMARLRYFMPSHDVAFPACFSTVTKPHCSSLVLAMAHLIPAWWPSMRLLHRVEVLHQRPGSGRVPPSSSISSPLATFLVSFFILVSLLDVCLGSCRTSFQARARHILYLIPFVLLKHQKGGFAPRPGLMATALHPSCCWIRREQGIWHDGTSLCFGYSVQGPGFSVLQLQKLVHTSSPSSSASPGEDVLESEGASLMLFACTSAHKSKAYPDLGGTSEMVPASIVSLQQST